MFDKLFKLVKSLVFRIHVLKVATILLFLVVVGRIYMIQVTHSDEYKAYLERSGTVSLQKNVPRGVIYDRNFNVMVDNEAVNTITYQLYSDVSTSEMKEIATYLAELIDMGEVKLTSRDLKDLYIEKFPEEAKALITEEETALFKAGELTDNDLYKLQLERITEEYTNQLTDLEKEAHAIYINMNKGTNLTSNIIKKGATLEEVAVVSEHLEYLPGVNTEVDWDRTYPSAAGRHPVFGRVSTYEQGLPASEIGFYKAHDYQNNDRVGMSQLELYYEFLLSGYKSQYVLTNENDVSNYNELYEGQRGYEMVLTIDSELQASVDEIVSEALLSAKSLPGAEYMREAYIVMLDPNTGEVLSLSGKIIEYNEEEGKYEILDNSLGTVQSAFTVGSVVKGATLLAGYNYGVTNIGYSLTDAPMYFKGGLKKGSWKALGYINDSDALKFSSNVYFFQQTIRLGGSVYQPYGALVLDLDVFDKYRDFFAQFGLGVSTGIDLPNESIGLKDTSLTSGKLLDFAIGQADIYTPLQLAQYVSTIATKGYRYAPTILRDVYVPSNENPDEKQLLKGFEPTLLNVIDMDESYFDRVHNGFKRALQESGGTGYGLFDLSYNPAGKTGTAQEYARDSEGKYIRDSSGNLIEVYMSSFVGFAPADDPEVAMAVIVPQAAMPNKGNNIAFSIANQSFLSYFDLKKQQAQQEETENVETEETPETEEVE
ncbi:MAG TPA: penicillin-binding protein 2 [Firmicutes bacterium]|nr:penicillin-binding protein 2 [Bacillota bacterium]